jgi:hypothetical protein
VTYAHVVDRDKELLTELAAPGLVACHQRHVTEHLGDLVELRDRAGSPGERLRTVLKA